MCFSNGQLTLNVNNVVHYFDALQHNLRLTSYTFL